MLDKEFLLEVKEELEGREYNIIDLSNKLQGFGFEDICDFGNWREILESENVVVAVQGDWEEQIQIDFKIIKENDENEVCETTIVEILDIYEY